MNVLLRRGAMVVGLTLGLATGAAQAHTALCSCYDNNDGTILCEGGFSDGSSASGVKMVVSDKQGKKLLDGAMNKNSEFSFKKPDGEFTVLFDGGEGHQIEIKGADIH
jgi:hypothetical protein